MKIDAIHPKAQIEMGMVKDLTSEWDDSRNQTDS